MPKRVISEKELTACYGLMFSEYPDIVNIRQLQTMLGISRHAAYDLLGDAALDCIKLGNAYKIPKVNVIRYVLEASAARAERVSHVEPLIPSQGGGLMSSYAACHRPAARAPPRFCGAWYHPCDTTFAGYGGGWYHPYDTTLPRPGFQ